MGMTTVLKVSGGGEGGSAKTKIQTKDLGRTDEKSGA